MPERSLHDPSSPSYLGHYFLTSIGFDVKIERDWSPSYSVPPALQKKAAVALSRWLRLGQESAKFDHAYLLTSVWCADDELVELAGGKNAAEKDLHPLFRAKRNVVQFWRESAGLAGGSHPLAPTSSPDEVYKRHLAKFKEMTVPDDDADPLPSLLAKAAYSSQIISTLTSPNVALPNSSKMRANSGMSEDSEFMEPQPPSAQREAEEEDFNLDWFYDLIGCCNPTQSTENSVSPFHPDECEERISSGEVSSPSRQGGFAVCVEMLKLQTADLKQVRACEEISQRFALARSVVTNTVLKHFRSPQALVHFDEALESSFRSVCSKKDAVSFDFSLARSLLEMDYGPTTAEQDQLKTQPRSLLGSMTAMSAARSLGSSADAAGAAPTSPVKPLHQDTKRRDLALACSHVVDPTSVKAFESLISSCFLRSSSATDESYKNCQISYAYQTPRFIEGRISGYASLLRSAAGEKNYLEMFVKRAAYEVRKCEERKTRG